MVDRAKRRKPDDGKAEPPVVYPAFAALLRTRLDKIGLTNAEAGEAIGDKNGEMIRRYRKGWVMPRPGKLKKLAILIGLTPAELQHPGSSGRAVVPGLVEGFALLEPDEQLLIDAYRQLKPFGQKAARARVVELLEEFGVPGATNPWAKGRVFPGPPSQ